MAKAETIDEELVLGLKAAKTKRCYFALVAKGSNDGALVISKQKIPPVLITVAKKKCGGSAVIKGAVVYEDGKYVFETPKPPAATLPATLKLLARRDAGLVIVAICRLSTDPEVLAEAGDGAGPSDAAPQAGDKAPRDEIHPAVAAEQFRERLKVLMPRYRAVLAAFPTQNATLEPLLKAVTLAAQKQLFAQGLIVLDRFEAALTAATTTKSTSQTQSTSQNGQAEFDRRFKELTPSLKRALALQTAVNDDLKREVHAAQSLAKSGDFKGANLGLNKVEGLIQRAFELPPARQPAAGDFATKWKPARAAWQAATEKVDQQMSQLQQALLKTDDPELHEIAELGLNGVTGDFKVSLMAALHELEGTSPEKLPQSAGKIRDMIGKFQSHLASDATVTVCDKNPFGVSVSIRKLLIPALAEVQKVLETVGAA